MAVVSPHKLRSDISRLNDSGHCTRDFALGAARILRRGMPFDGVCVLTMDPATLLPTGEVVENGLPETASARLTEIEIGEPDYNKFVALARGRRTAASLSEATGGDLLKSRRHRELRRPHGFEDELRAALVTNSGIWGAITLLRKTGRPHFTRAEADTVAALSQDFAEGLRRASLLQPLYAGEEEGAGAGLLLLAPDNSIEMASPAAERWLGELEDGSRPGGHIPPVVNAVASRARAGASGSGDGGPPARARVLAHSGRWLLVRGSMLGDGADARAGVILEAARSPELAPLMAAAYGLTGRERAVTELVAQGLRTDEIGRRLYVSPYTVQDHLKSIFEKVGVGTRGELVARLFFEHYAPQLTRETPQP